MEEGPAGVVTGHVVVRSSPALPPAAVLTVTLADVSRADAPAQILACQIIAPPGEPPIPFALSYDRDHIIPNHTYAVRARRRERAAAAHQYQRLSCHDAWRAHGN